MMKPMAMMKRVNVHSIQCKLMASAAVLIILLATIATIVVYSSLSKHMLQLRQQGIADAVQLSATIFDLDSESAQKNALALANSLEVSALIRSKLNGGVDPLTDFKESNWRSAIVETFSATLRSNTSYLQVRLIGMRNNGLELVRVRRAGGVVSSVAAEQLESHPGSDFLTDGATLGPGETRMVSWHPANGGKHAVSIMHAIAAVNSPSGRVVGIVVVDVDLSTMSHLQGLNTKAESSFYIVNQNGEILLPAVPATDLSAGIYNLADEFPNFDPMPDSGFAQPHVQVQRDVLGKQQIVVSYSLAINPYAPGEYLTFVHAVPYADFLATVSPYLKEIAGTAAVLVFLSMLLVARFSRTLVGPLDRMTDTIVSFASGNNLLNLPLGRKDQIGVLARAFSDLIGSLDRRRAELSNEVATRKHAVEESKSSEARYRASIDLMRDAHIVSDVTGIIQSVNHAGEVIFGYGRAELIGRNINMLLPEENRAGHVQTLEQYRKTGEKRIIGVGRDTGLYGCRKNGDRFPLSLLIRQFHVDEVVYFAAIIRDITNKQNIEAQNTRLRTVVEHATDCIVLTNLEGVIEYVNPQFELDYGYASDEVLGKCFADMGWRRSDAAIYEEIAATVRNGKAWSGQLLSKAKDGTTMEHDVSVTPVFDAAGHTVNKVYIARDIGERNRLERQLAQAQKLEAIGQLAAGIAHEINTPTQYVGDNTRFVKDAFEDVGVLFATLTELKASANGSISTQAISEAMEKADVEYLQEEVSRALAQSIEGVERVTKIVRAMKEFSHPAQDKTPLDLNAAIQSTITVASNEWKYVADVNTEFDPDLPLVTCLPGPFNQVVLNMIVNAAHAIADVLGTEPADKGAITISTRALTDCAEICIADTGAGMPEDVMEHIFEPFFTTKEVGKGTGQGLNIAYTVVVEKHGGTIAVESTPGQGTCFTIHLPLEEPVSADDTVAA